MHTLQLLDLGFDLLYEKPRCILDMFNFAFTFVLRCTTGRVKGYNVISHIISFALLFLYNSNDYVYIYNCLENIGIMEKKNFIIILLKSDAYTNTWKYLYYISIFTLRSQIFCSKYFSFLRSKIHCHQL